MATNEERSEATRARLLAIARKRFGTKGYAATSVEDLVRRAGVTKGAFYHHFDDKKSVFLAVLEDAQQRLAQACVATARGEDAWERALAGCHAFLEACTDPEIQQIILLDGPVVLGWETWREIDSRYSLGALEAGLRETTAAVLVRRGRAWKATIASRARSMTLRPGTRLPSVPTTVRHRSSARAVAR